MRLVLVFCVLAAPAWGQGHLTTFQRAEARALLRSQLPCLGCHELDGEGGRSAPSLTTVGTRRSAAYIAAMVDDPQHRLPGAAMPRHAMPAAVRHLVVGLLAENATGPDVPLPPQPQRNLGATPEAAALYAKWCASCHGESGRGDGPNAARLPVPPAHHADSAAMSRRPDDSLYDVIGAGGLEWGRSARMPAFGSTLSTAEIRSLVGHIRTLCGCEGPVWSQHTAAGANPAAPPRAPVQRPR